MFWALVSCTLIPWPLPDFISQPWRKLCWFFSTLWDEIWEWPGDVQSHFWVCMHNRLNHVVKSVVHAYPKMWLDVPDCFCCCCKVGGRDYIKLALKMTFQDFLSLHSSVTYCHAHCPTHYSGPGTTELIPHHRSPHWSRTLDHWDSGLRHMALLLLLHRIS